MKFLLIMFVFLCLHAPKPSSGGKANGKKGQVVAKKTSKSSFNLAPSILIINY
jgi:hypothetical protein